MLYRLGVYAATNRRKVVVVWVLAAVSSLLLLPGLLSSIGLPAVGIRQSEANQAADALVKDFPVIGRDQMYLAFRSDRLVATDVGFEAAMHSAALALSKQEGIVSVIWLPLAAEAARPGRPMTMGPLNFDSLPYRDPHNAYVLVGSQGDDHQQLTRFAKQRDAVELAVREASAGAVRVLFAGRIPLAHEMRTTELADNSRTEALTVPLALLMLLFGLGTLGSAVIPLLIASAGIVVTFGVFALLSHIISFDANLLFASSVTGFALGIDYLLLLTSRYREELRKGRNRPHAAGLATATAGGTIACSGLVAIVAVSCLLVVQTPLLRQFAVGVTAAALVAMLAALTLGPALLVFWTPLLDRGRIRGWGGERNADHGVWARWATHVIRHPKRYLLAGGGVLIMLAMPALDLRPGTDLESHLSHDTNAKKVLNLIERDSFAGGAAGISVIVPRATGSPSQVAALMSALDRDPAVVSVGQTVGPSVTAISIIPSDTSSSAQTTELVRRIRTQLIPAYAPGTGVLVGGASALLVDDQDEVVGKTLVMVVGVLLSSFLLLLLIFRGLLVAIKAVVANALAVAAGIGIVVVVFQWGYGESLLGFHSDGSILFYAPYIAFVAVYALSMDYEIFLVRRIRETYLATGDHDRAIAVGLQRTAQPIVIAGAIMVIVYLGMFFASSMAIRQIGLALIAAIAVDVTLVRLVIVPAGMKILGRWNWWLPGVKPQRVKIVASRKPAKTHARVNGDKERTR